MGEAIKTKKLLPQYSCSLDELNSFRIICKKLDVANEATQVVGRDPGFYEASMNIIATTEVEKDKWWSVIATRFPDIPTGVAVDLGSGEFYIME